jgi:shikimate dehydrogenase
MKFGLIGRNIGYSKSKEIFEAKGIEYHVYDVPYVEQGIEMAIADQLNGFNVTKPFKKDIVKYMDSLLHDAYHTKTVNCVKIIDDRFIGENFDGEAFRNSLEYYLSSHEDWESKFPRKIAILGNGGVVPAILNGLHEAINMSSNAKYSVAMTVYARNPDVKTENPLSKFKAKDHDLIINTIPFEAKIDINFNNKHKFIYYDLNYADDTLIKKAQRNKNCSWAINGMDMLERQADMALNWWNE